MALALALITTAGLTVKSLLRLQAEDLGWTHDRVLTFGVGLPALVAPDDAAVARFQSDFLARVRAVPGVTHASAINLLPIAATGSNGPVRRADQNGEHDGVPVTEFRAVMDGYFEAMSMRLLAGRPINDHDRAGTLDVAVVNETLAGRLFPGVDASRIIGQPVKIGWLFNKTSEIVGVVANVRSRRPDAPPDPEVYVPFAQAPQATMSYVVRATGDPAALTGQIRAALAAMHPDVALANVRTLDDVVTAATRMSRLVSWLSVLFGVLAAVLAIVGIYGVMSYAVAQRERELAIRAAVGASRVRLLALVVKEGLTLSGAGIVAGALLAFQASGVLRTLLYGVSATDPLVFGAAAAGLAAIAFGGYVIPALRAARVNPVEALRRD
jgi:predicted permease